MEKLLEIYVGIDERHHTSIELFQAPELGGFAVRDSAANTVVPIKSPREAAATWLDTITAREYKSP